MPTAYSQNINTTTDLSDILKKIFKKNTTPTKETSTGISILPSMSYNPSFGGVLGAKSAIGLQLGDPQTTDYSVFGLELLTTSKGYILLQARHNAFTPGNKWNFQGNWLLSKFGQVDFGLFPNSFSAQETGISVERFQLKESNSSFPIFYSQIRFQEKVYHSISKNMYAGLGLHINQYKNIDDSKLSTQQTPHASYSDTYGFSKQKYAANGWNVLFQYNTREHPVRAYSGIYAEVDFNLNTTWMGSTQNAGQISFDFRKYWSMSKIVPEKVLAIWYWSTHTVWGRLPYLNFPGTGSDTYARSGRGYTIGRFKGPSYAVFETEYRFPITTNKLLSGVAFTNMQTVSDENNSHLYKHWKLGAGGGFRILFKKQSRTTLCVDYAFGANNAQGLFFGLNEVF